MTKLSQRFGHEENLSRYLLQSGQFEALLARAGFKIAGKGSLELPVKHGHKGHQGRLDIHQPTTAGVVIGEMQYGVSDSNHRNRFEGYVKSVSNAAAVVWVAEEFRTKDLDAVVNSKTPILCVKAALNAAGELILKVIGGARLSAQSLTKRTERLTKQAWKWIDAVDWSEAWLDEMVRWGGQNLNGIDVSAVYSHRALAERQSTNDKRLAQCKASPDWPQMLRHIKESKKLAQKKIELSERIRPIVERRVKPVKKEHGEWSPEFFEAWDVEWKKAEKEISLSEGLI